MNTTISTLFSQVPGLASSFNDIFNEAPAAPSAPPTPAPLPAPTDIHAVDADVWPTTF